MSDSASTVDRRGRTVKVGTTVRVIEINPELLRDLPGNERRTLRSMLGRAFVVYEVDEQGAAWVQKMWTKGQGLFHGHSLALDPHEMEVV